MPVPPNRPFYPRGNPNDQDGRGPGGSLGGPRAGGFNAPRAGRGAPRGNTSREGSWKRTEGGPRARPTALRLAALRADLERMLRELDEASKALTHASAKIPASSVLEHTQGPAVDAIFAPWRRVRAALADVEMACVAIERVKFPPKPFIPKEFRPRL
ncbi:MAG: hypothetical protein EXS01_02140 [Phycisphaerales bacterium]|nr:hypothetical protein [Phycisphaerales bacterium]